MSQAQFTIPLITVIPGQLITAVLWNNEFLNLQTNLNPSGIGGYSDTDTQMQIQTAPYPGSVTSHASSLAGEIERIRYQLSAVIGLNYWYQAPELNLDQASAFVIPIGGVIDYPNSIIPVSPYWHLADGSAISRSVYSKLFTLIGTTFGIGDGSTTFNIPNYTDRMSIAAGNLYSLGAIGGAATSTVAIADPGHNHTQNAHTHTDSGHTHTTPNHQHQLDHTTAGAIPGNPSGTQINSVDSDGSGLFAALSGGLATIRKYLNQTVNSGAGTSGSGSANISSDVAVNQSNTTGITATNPNLPPYLGMYKMIRIL